MHLSVIGLWNPSPTTLWLCKIRRTENANDHRKALSIYLFAPRTQDLTDPGRDL